MRITDLQNLGKNFLVKPSRRSITIKDERTLKTAGVVTDVERVKDLPFNRKVDFNIKYKGKLPFYDTLYTDYDGNLFYLLPLNSLSAGRYKKEAVQVKNIEPKAAIIEVHDIIV